MATTLLEIINLTKVFHLHILGEKTIQALPGVSLTLAPGEFLAISGPSGTGKSSLLKCIYRTYLPTQGQIWYTSREYGPLDLAQAHPQLLIQLRRREIGYASQFLQVIPRVSSLDIVAAPLLGQNGVSLDAARQQAAAMLARLRIPAQLFEAYPATFSGGEQQRLNIARAAISRPRLLLLDEPTASLDREAAADVVQLLRELKEGGTAILGIFHHLEQVAGIVDRVYEMPARGADHDASA
jgi:alpha-D-ribose 1-methylphosphonate 5-triphosphate synthase subunit PhnL